MDKQQSILTVPIVQTYSKDFQHHHNLAYKNGKILWLCNCIPEEPQKSKIEKKAIKVFEGVTP